MALASPDTVSAEPRLERLEGLTLVGIAQNTTLAEQGVAELWQRFMPGLARIPRRVDDSLLYVRNYAAGMDFSQFSPRTRFEHWAAVSVTAVTELPAGMQAGQIPAGDYAVFVHRGPASAAAASFHYIFAQWLPASDFVLDERPHFDVLPPGYRPDDPHAEEQLWVPVRRRDASDMAG